jgi:hypothetical protein
MNGAGFCPCAASFCAATSDRKINRFAKPNVDLDLDPHPQKRAGPAGIPTHPDRSAACFCPGFCMSRIFLSFVLAALTGISSNSPGRTFTNQKGQTFDASLVSADSTTAELMGKDGKRAPAPRATNRRVALRRA